jgi:acetyl-CoA C-acetyltransferase
MGDNVIVSAARTPVGSFMGTLAPLPSPQLGAIAIKAALERAGVKPDQVDEIIMGCVLSGGVGQAPARQAMVLAGLPWKVCALTINKVCGSGLKAVMLADAMLTNGDADIIVAGGMESMSNAPYILPGARQGYRMGDQKVVDLMIHDGLWDVYKNCHMGACADQLGKEWNITRKEQDDFAIRSYKRALKSITDGKFKAEIVPVEIPQKKGAPVIVAEDEGPRKFREEKMPELKPAFTKDGGVTAANASSLNDGGAATVVMSKKKADSLGLKPLARIVGHCSAGRESDWFTIAPIDAVKKLFAKTGYSADKIDLFEINEAFSVQVIAALKEFKLSADKVNVNGGSVAIGHPIGASGARVLTTLLYAMQDRKAKTGLATLCIGGGEAAAMIVERI